MKVPNQITLNLKNISGVLLVFDMADPTSLDSILDWYRILEENGSKIPCILVGAKKDLVDPSMNLETLHVKIEALKSQLNLCDYIETSAKIGLNSDQIFMKMVQNLVDGITFNTRPGEVPTKIY